MKPLFAFATRDHIEQTVDFRVVVAGMQVRIVHVLGKEPQTSACGDRGLRTGVGEGCLRRPLPGFYDPIARRLITIVWIISARS